MILCGILYEYVTYEILGWITRETDLEFDRQLWNDDPDMDVISRDWRDIELYFDITGNIDASL